jgi:hypothetical protein
MVCAQGRSRVTLNRSRNRPMIDIARSVPNPASCTHQSRDDSEHSDDHRTEYKDNMFHVGADIWAQDQLPDR